MCDPGLQEYMRSAGMKTEEEINYLQVVLLGLTVASVQHVCCHFERCRPVVWVSMSRTAPAHRGRSKVVPGIGGRRQDLNSHGYVV